VLVVVVKRERGRGSRREKIGVGSRKCMFGFGFKF